MTGHFQRGMTQEFLEHKRIAAAINEILAGKSMPKQMERGFLYTSASVVALNGKAEGIGGEHFAVFITEKIITISAAARFTVISENTNHLRAEGDYLNFVRFGMSEYNATVGKINISVLDVADGGGTAARVQKKVDNHPVAVFAEITVCFWLFQKETQFFIGVGVFCCFHLFVVGDG